jgi:integral membrane sensor domain MASE1
VSFKEETTAPHVDTEADSVAAHVGSRIRRCRLDRGRSLRSLAAQLNIPPEQLDNYESGKDRITASQLKEVADALHAPLSHFFEGLSQRLDNTTNGWRHFIAGLKGPLCLSIAYYLGAQAAFYVGTLSDHIFAPFWPPNIILLCVLLFVPYRRWWLYVVAAVPAHVFSELQVGMLWPQIAVAFATNCAVAFLSAVMVRRVLGAPPWLDNFQKAVAFVVITAVISPAVAAVGGAFVRISAGAALESYGLFWAQWYLANALASLTLGPAILTWIGRSADASGPSSRWRQGEAVLVGVGLALACLVTGQAITGDGGLPALLYLPLPLIVWAAVRFGTIGASGAVLIVTVVTIWTALNGHGMFVYAAPEQNVLDLQLFLTAVSVPVLLLGASVDGARRAEEVTRALARCLMAARDEDRRRIGNDLHESISQTLVGAARIAEDARRASPELSGTFGHLGEMLRKSIRDIHELSNLLHPPMLDEAGLEIALSRYVEGYSLRNRTKVTLEISPDVGRLAPNVELGLFRLAEQALDTVRRESPGVESRIKIAAVLASGERTILLTVAGVAAGKPLRSHVTSLINRVIPLGGRQSIEVASMRERVGRIGGRLLIDFVAGNALVQAIVPVGREQLRRA